MTIWNKKYFFDRIETTYQFLSSLKSFCAVFSIQDVRIVRQLKKPTNHSLNLEERIGYGIYEKTIN
jgi:DNA-binding transcriptional regulator WhiA